MNPRTITAELFTDINQAVYWREHISHADNEYLRRVGNYLFNMQPDDVLDVTKVVTTEKLPLFYKCFSYLNFLHWWEWSYNDDFTRIRLNAYGRLHPSKQNANSLEGWAGAVA